ncbi:uncharacterized protein LOC134773418 [Penaeus indicus]|uniref:uncharacterized protein LOC134773418 n=1 Tax=Penaeus indicus TaxID=29960 RepID=UPI00300D8420
MEFGIKKCRVLVMKKGRHHKSGIELASEDKIKEIDLEEGYKYLGVLEADSIKEKIMKENVRKEYIRWVKEIQRSKLNRRNTISAINARAVSIIRYIAGTVGWKTDELQSLDRRTRKLLTTYNMFQSKGDVDRLYQQRSEGGRKKEDCVLIEKSCLYCYVSVSEELLLKESLNESVVAVGHDKETVLTIRKSKFLEKKLHSVFFKAIEFRDVKRYEWLRKGDWKKAAEGTLMAGQEQAIRTRSIQHRIDRVDIPPNCRICDEREETVAHIVSECGKLAQKQYKQWRQDNVAQTIHWQLCKDNSLEHNEQWYDHRPKAIVENESFKLLWDMRIQTDRELAYNNPDIIAFNKDKRTCLIIDVTCPFDYRLPEGEREKIDCYDELKRELKRIWNCREIKIVPIVIGAFGTISTRSHS